MHRYVLMIALCLAAADATFKLSSRSDSPVAALAESRDISGGESGGTS
jgi:hypothetical protein